MKTHRAWAGSSDDGTVVDLTPEDAGWAWTGLRVLALADGESRTVRTDQSEVFVLPLAGSLDLTVQHDDGADLGAFALTGRVSVFDAVTDFVYIGRDCVVRLTAVAGPA